MKQLKKYIDETLGVSIHIKEMQNKELGRLPLYIIEMYQFYDTKLFDHDFILIENKHVEDFSISQTEKHFSLIQQNLQKEIVLLIYEITSFNRKRLIVKGINFIVPGKQLFLPGLLMDIKESFSPVRSKKRKQKLQPSAQFILLYHILHRNEALDLINFKDIANKFSYTQTAITKAIEDLAYHDLIIIEGTRAKSIQFKLNRVGVWQKLINEELYVNPVMKRIYVDEIPDGIKLLHSNANALAEYTSLNPGRDHYFAIEKSIFYKLQKGNKLINLNDNEGLYCLEIWKYDPIKLAIDAPVDIPVVDPLSLYLSMKDSNDERIAMELEKLLKDYIW